MRPEPHLREGRLLASAGGARAAIDVSDGLSSDLAHIVEESRVGARLFAERLPVSDALRHYCARFGRSPLEYALRGGEDYVLLVTVAAERADALAGRFAAEFGRPLHRIGTITEAGGMEIVDADGTRATARARGLGPLQRRRAWHTLTAGRRPAPTAGC